MTEEPGRTSNQAVLSAWQAELKAIHNPSIKQQCLQRASELLPRFAAHYQPLKALRRRVRRAASSRKYVSFELADKLACSLPGQYKPAHERLPNREFEVLRRLARGESLTAIATALHMSTKTVSTYRSRILQKTGLTSNAELIRYALENGLLT